MTDPTIRAEAIRLHDRFTHEGGDRRAFMADMTRLAGGVAAAELLLGAIAADPAAAAIVAEDDARLETSYVDWADSGRQGRGYLVRPRGAGRLSGVIVIHENRGLTPHIRDVARRMALAGHVALAPDLLAPLGGTPADEDAGRAMIGKLDLAAATADALAVSRWLARGRRSSGRIGVVGFCWGGAMVDRMAVAGGRAIDAGVAYYGPAPNPSEAAKVQMPLLLHFAGLDDRVNKGGEAWAAALKAAGKDVTAWTYPGVNHAFNNDGSAERYDPAAAALAWGRTTAFLAEHLG